MAKKSTYQAGGAVAGAAIGSAFAPGVGTAIGAGIGGGLGGLFGSDEDEDLKRYQEEQRKLRESAKAAQLSLLGSMRAPTLSDATRKRIAALEEESKMTPLAEDPLFQAQRATVVQGGQQALSGVQNAQQATGTSGGFSNQGSINDVYDRLGAQLANLGQQSRETKERKRDQAAEMQQHILDAQTEFENAQIQARIAIESGDATAAAAALQQAYAAKQAADAASQQMTGSLLGAGITAFGPSLLKSGQPTGGGIKSGAQVNNVADMAANLDYSTQIGNWDPDEVNTSQFGLLSNRTGVPYSLMKRRMS